MNWLSIITVVLVAALAAFVIWLQHRQIAWLHRDNERLANERLAILRQWLGPIAVPGEPVRPAAVAAPLGAEKREPEAPRAPSMRERIKNLRRDLTGGTRAIS